MKSKIAILIIASIIMFPSGYYFGYSEASVNAKEKYRGFLKCDKYGNWVIDKFDIYGMSYDEVYDFMGRMCRYKIT